MSLVRRSLVPLASSALLTLWLTWPLAVETARPLRGTGDYGYSAWVLAWLTHGLTTAPWRLAEANIFWPDDHTLFYGPAALGALPFFAPVYLATRDAVRSVNVTFWTCLALTGAAIHWVVWRWTRSHAAGLVAAASFLTTPWVSSTFLPRAPHLAALQCLPLIVFLSRRQLASARSRAWLGLLVILQCATDLVYVAPAVLGPLGALALVRLARPATRRVGVRLARVLVVSVAALAPVAWGYTLVARRNPDLAANTLWVDASSRTNLPWDLVSPDRPAAFRGTMVAVLVVGFLMMASRRHGRSLPRSWQTALFWCLVGFFLTLGAPVLVGSYEVPSPHGVLADFVPALAKLRVPSRLGIASLVGLSLLVGLAFAQIAKTVRRALRPTARPAVWIATLVFIVVERLHVDAGPMAMSPPRLGRGEASRPPAAFLEVLAREPGPLVEVPTVGMPRATSEPAERKRSLTFSSEQADAMLRSTHHWHPIVNGYSSYFPERFRERFALVERLPDQAALAALVRETDLRFVWVHRDRLVPRHLRAWQERADQPAAGPPPTLRLVAATDDELLFLVER
jgi:hypothetical protein